MARGSKRLGLHPDALVEICLVLESAHQALTKVTASYPITFDPAAPYGAAHQATKAIHAVGEVLTGNGELFSSQRRNPNPPFHKR